MSVIVLSTRKKGAYNQENKKRVVFLTGFISIYFYGFILVFETKLQLQIELSTEPNHF